MPILTVERIAVVALVVILFNGGIDIGMRRLRASLVPVLSLGLVGTFLRAAAIAAVAHWLLGMDWTLAGLIGAALAPTDPAVMFSVLGRREIGGRSGTTLEGEAGMNDPAGIALMIGMIELATSDHATLLVVGQEFAVEMVIGAAFGLIGARLIVPVLARAHLPSESLYPVLALVLAFGLYGAASVAHGSGFLAVFLAGLAVGDSRLPYKPSIERFQAALAGLAELVVFIALGLTVRLSDLGVRDWLEGLALFVVLAVAIRPIVVAVTLAGVRMSRPRRPSRAVTPGRPAAAPPQMQKRGGVDRAPADAVQIGSEPTGAREHRVEAGSPADGMALASARVFATTWASASASRERSSCSARPPSSSDLTRCSWPR